MRDFKKNSHLVLCYLDTLLQGNPRTAVLDLVLLTLFIPFNHGVIYFGSIEFPKSQH